MQVSPGRWWFRQHGLSRVGLRQGRRPSVGFHLEFIWAPVSPHIHSTCIDPERHRAGGEECVRLDKGYRCLVWANNPRSFIESRARDAGSGWLIDCPVNTRRSPNAGLLLGHRRRRWPNSNPALGERHAASADWIFAFRTVCNLQRGDARCSTGRRRREQT